MHELRAIFTRYNTPGCPRTIAAGGSVKATSGSAKLRFDWDAGASTIDNHTAAAAALAGELWPGATLSGYAPTADGFVFIVAD